MFFSISSVKNVLIYLHACAGRNAALISDLQHAVNGFNCCWITREDKNWWHAFGIDNKDVVAASTPAECRLFQNVIRKALLTKGFERENTVVVSSDPEIIGAASQLLLGTIDLRIDQTPLDPEDYGPDFSVSSAESIRSALTGELSGYPSEFFSTPDDCFAVKKQRPATLTFGTIQNDHTIDNYGGRYFSRGDSRHDLHALSLRIVDSKRNFARQTAAFRSAFAFLIGAVTQGKFDYISHVPAKPGQVDRFQTFLQNIHKEPDLAKYDLNAACVNNSCLTCIRPYESLKNFKAVDRPDRLKGAFQADVAVKGKTIVLLDDVRTTGSTISECAETLLNRGAKEVIPITLTFKPFQNTTLEVLMDTPPYSGCCEWPGVIRFNGTHGEPFYGCSAWQPNDRVRHGSGTFAKVTKYLLNESKTGLMAYDDELGSFIDF